MTNARRGFAALALVTTLGCGGSKPPPASPGGEIDLTAPSSSESPSTVPAPAVEGHESPPREQALFEGSETIDEVVVKRLSAGAVPQPRPDAPSRGPADAKVLIQIWSDFECPFCADAVPLVAELQRRFGSTIRVSWRAFPLPNHKNARRAVAAALHIHRQRGNDAFWRAHDQLFAHAVDGLTPGEIDQVVSGAGVELDEFRRAVAASAFDQAIDADMAAADPIIDGTPSFLIGRYYLYGIAPYSVYGDLIEKALAESR